MTRTLPTAGIMLAFALQCLGQFVPGMMGGQSVAGRAGSAGPPEANMIFWHTFSGDLLAPDYGQMPTTNGIGSGATIEVDAVEGAVKFVYPSDSARTWFEWPDGAEVDPDLYSEFTITLWVKKSNYFGHFGNAQYNSEGFFLANSASLFGHKCSSTYFAAIGGFPADWTFVAARFNTTRAELKYGTLAWAGNAVGACSGTRVVALGGLYFGRNGTHYIDDVRIYSAWLSDAQVEANRTGGRQ